eukprot:TRINITY_DN35487_c0_g1_i1.p1 TRINITY_DN35487_c0_g1~~TRINITY_DN35487_c0_g1_i1.p1  ORF type:complete len:345 (+),score=62.74 TRINITY_DN35487_c0_g1_i1:68-1102(+)
MAAALLAFSSPGALRCASRPLQRRACAGVSKIVLDGVPVRAWGPPAWRKLEKAAAPQLEAGGSSSSSSSAALPEPSKRLVSAGMSDADEMAVLGESEALPGGGPEMPQSPLPDIVLQGCWTAAQRRDLSYFNETHIEPRVAHAAEALKLVLAIAEAARASQQAAVKGRQPKVTVDAVAFEPQLVEVSGGPATRMELCAIAEGDMTLDHQEKQEPKRRLSVSRHTKDDRHVDDVLAEALADVLPEGDACEVYVGAVDEERPLYRAIEAIAVAGRHCLDVDSPGLPFGSKRRLIVRPRLTDDWHAYAANLEEDAAVDEDARGRASGGWRRPQRLLALDCWLAVVKA